MACFGGTCDQWIESYPDLYTCEVLEDAHECDCSLCTCVAPLLPPGLPPAPPPPSPPQELLLAECEDEKGSKWCGKKTKKATKQAKFCASKKVKKCRQTCATC